MVIEDMPQPITHTRMGDRAVYTVQQLATRWGMTVKYVYREIRAGRLRSFSIGPGDVNIRVRHEWVDAYELGNERSVG